MPSLNELSAIEIQEKIRTQEISAEELISACFDRIEKVEDRIKAFVTLRKKAALAEAKKTDKRIKSGKKIGVLAGIPLAVKDLISVKRTQTSCGSKMLKNYVPPYDATVIQR